MTRQPAPLSPGSGSPGPPFFLARWRKRDVGLSAAGGLVLLESELTDFLLNVHEFV